MKLLVSVRSVDEALQAAGAGVHFIDLKEPGQGALGGLPVDAIAAIFAALRACGGHFRVSATIGDLPLHEGGRIARAVAQVGACGVDYVKVGIARAPAARPVLDALAASGHAVVPVFIADDGLDWLDVGHACRLGFPALMVDTQDKRRGSLFDALPADALQRFIDTVRAAGALAGVAGALRVAQLPRLRELAPDFAGFRSAVCAGDRSAALDPARLQQLVDQLRDQATYRPPPSSSARTRSTSAL